VIALYFFPTVKENRALFLLPRIQSCLHEEIDANRLRPAFSVVPLSQSE